MPICSSAVDTLKMICYTRIDVSLLTFHKLMKPVCSATITSKFALS